MNRLFKSQKLAERVQEQKDKIAQEIQTKELRQKEALKHLEADVVLQMRHIAAAASNSKQQ